MMTLAVWLAQGMPPATVAFTTTQMTIAISLGIVSLTGAGVAFGRLMERQKGDHALLGKTLTTLEVGMASLTTSVNELRVDRGNWALWRVLKDEGDADRDESIAKLQDKHGDHETRLVVVELQDRRHGEADRRQPHD